MTLLRRRITATTAWQHQARCLGADPDDFFTDDSAIEAKAACSTCPVRQQCLDEAMAAEGAIGPDGRFGIFGGLGPAERATLAVDQAAVLAPVRIEQPKRTRWHGRELEPCGTRAAYRRHLRRSESPCRLCEEAEYQSRRDRYARRKGEAA